MQIPQAKNAKADFLARLASLDDYNAPSELCIEIRGQSSTKGEQILKEKKKKKGSRMDDSHHSLFERRIAPKG